MGSIAPLDAVADAVADYFNDLIPALKVIRGWPSRSEDLDLDGADLTGAPYRAAMSVYVSPSYDLEPVVPVEVDRTLSGGKLDLLYRVAFVTGSLQLDVWAGHRSTRDEFVQLVIENSANRLPFTSDIRLLSTGFFGRDGYHGRPSKVSLMQGKNLDESGDVETGQWRHSWTASVITDFVLPKTHNRIGLIRNDLTTDLGGILITESKTTP